MLIYSQDRKSVVEADVIQVQKNISGEYKYIISASSGARGAIVAAKYAEEKDAVDALEKAYQAFADGAGAYRFD